MKSQKGEVTFFSVASEWWLQKNKTRWIWTCLKHLLIFISRKETGEKASEFVVELRTIDIRRPKKLSNFQDPPTPVHQRLTFFHPLDLGRPPPTFSNKFWNDNRTFHVNKRNQNKSIIKSRHIQIDHAFYCSI